MAPEPIIRHATEQDVHTIHTLIHELAAYEREPPSTIQATPSTLLNTLSFPSSSSSSSSSPSTTQPSGFAKCFLVVCPPSARKEDEEEAEEVAGMALYFTNYSTWTGAPGIYLEDLFVREAYRGRGYGKALLKELAREVGRIGGRRLDWSVLKWNKPSIDFYESEAVGAKMMSEWVGMRVEGEALRRLAGGKEEG
ncbi:MAG: hypothetical protein Q9227_007883 [Pyrenula ochraceoflavens]